jgi:Abnormal spindle-like microcephaly-assoc'd, ASPM-SPD-2-Hydin
VAGDWTDNASRNNFCFRLRCQATESSTFPRRAVFAAHRGDALRVYGSQVRAVKTVAILLFILFFAITAFGQLTANPSAINFGNVPLGTIATQSVTIGNSGEQSLTISQGSIVGRGFSLSGLTSPVTLSSGQSLNVTVTFSPQSAGTATGSISVAGGSEGRHHWSRTNNMSVLTVSLSGTGTSAGLCVANPSAVSFGSVLLGNSQTQSVTLSNSGGASITVSQTTTQGSGFSMGGPTLPVTLAAGQSTSFSVTFTPLAVGATNGNIAFASNASNSTLNVPLSGSGTAPGSLSPTPTVLNFNSVQTGSNQSLSESVTNTGGSSVTITQAAVTGSGFTVNGLNLPLILAPSQSSPSFNVVFAPQSAGAVSGALSLTSNGSNPTLSIPLSGTGVMPGTLTANPSSLSFGNVQIGNNQTLSETVTNVGGASVIISQDTVTGSAFSVTGLTFPSTLTSGESITFSVIFTPSSAGSTSASIAIASNASNSTLNVPLSGTGTAAGQLAVTPASSAFGNVVVGTSANLPATLSATGASVTVTSATVSSSEFSLSGLSFPVTIAAGNKIQFTVTFTPQATGAGSGTISFASNASDSPVLSLSGTGTPAPTYSVLLSWTASTSPSIAGYNIYRGTASAGPFARVNSSLNASTTYTDNSVVDGQAYYYVTTAVNSNDQESAYSTPPQQAVIPAP